MKKTIVIFGLVLLGLFLFGCTEQPVTCETDSGCGVASFSENYCNGTEVQRDYIEPKCVLNSDKQTCDEIRTPEKIKDCGPTPKGCRNGDCAELSCTEITGAVWIGGAPISRVYFDTPRQNKILNVVVMNDTNSTFKIHIFDDNSGMPGDKLFESKEFNDNDLTIDGWAKVDLTGISSMESGYYFIGIENTSENMMTSHFNGCVYDDKNPETYNLERMFIIDGEISEKFDNPEIMPERDIVYIFE